MTTIQTLPFGTWNGKEVQLFKLTNDNGVEVSITNFGGAVVSFMAPDREDQLADIVLGFPDLRAYLENPPYFGSIVGRYANRIENAKFTLNGVEYPLHNNNCNHHLHGGKVGFDKVLWNAVTAYDFAGDPFVQLSYLSRDGEEGYPGNLNVQVTYTLTMNNALVIHYHATTDQDTIVNLTNHSYFNLSGHKSGNVLEHLLWLNADYFTPIDPDCIPTGEIRPVIGTPMDFTEWRTIRSGLYSGDDQIAFGYGFDHNWILNQRSDPLKYSNAALYDPESGRYLQMFTTKPGVQCYTGNFLDGSQVGKEGQIYERWAGVCLEAQYYPNSPKHTHFPSPILRAGRAYDHTTIYHVSVQP
jgi:aldose 1-epimerase